MQPPDQPLVAPVELGRERQQQRALIERVEPQPLGERRQPQPPPRRPTRRHPRRERRACALDLLLGRHVDRRHAPRRRQRRMTQQGIDGVIADVHAPQPRVTPEHRPHPRHPRPQQRIEPFERRPQVLGVVGIGHGMARRR
ncbi:MAG: hypothetical protein H6705_05540 [Myxococcales bacterium]|nr:hypothetical protein [Myxococcales bacterium]